MSSKLLDLSAAIDCPSLLLNFNIYCIFYLLQCLLRHCQLLLLLSLLLLDRRQLPGEILLLYRTFTLLPQSTAADTLSNLLGKKLTRPNPLMAARIPQGGRSRPRWTGCGRQTRWTLLPGFFVLGQGARFLRPALTFSGQALPAL